MFVIIYCYIGGAVCIYKYESLVNCTKELLFTVNFILIFIQCWNDKSVTVHNKSQICYSSK